jgi:hypothetical protein
MMLNLELQCRVDDGGADRNDQVALADREEFRCPKLEYLAIDGRNCYEACRIDPQWTNRIANIWKLTVSNFHPNSGESFSPHELLLPLLAISNLDLLRITDLDLHPSPEPLEIPYSDLQPLGALLDLNGLHGFEVIDQIIRLRNNPDHISLIRCTFEDITDEFDYFADRGEGGILRLDMINHDLTPLLCLWHGHVLELTDCPRFDDALLEAMSTEEDGIFDCAAYLERLEIYDCSNFTVAALRRFVESRLGLPVDDLWNQDSPRVRSIRFHGNVPSMSQAEKAWFDANLTIQL